MTHRELLSALFGRRRFGVRPGTAAMRALLGALGSPQRELAVIHVGGTNGKGSTAAFLEAILRAEGRRTGLYTSPHLQRFAERIRVDGEELPDEELAALGALVLAAGPEATFFEAATAMAFCAFRDRGVEVAVIEVGLGGRHDATNVLEAPLATLVTGVALDHVEVLGPTVSDIARDKAGIFRAGVPAVIACDHLEARRVLEGEARAIGAPLVRLGEELQAGSWDEGRGEGLRYRGPGGALEVPTLGLCGAHQARNAGLAVAALASLPVGLRPGRAAIERGLREARWPGRLERVGADVLLDAAHNPDSARALGAALPLVAAGRPITLVLGVSSDKDAREIVAALAPVVARIIATTPPSPRALEAEALAALCPGGEVEPDPYRAVERARQGRGLVVVAGSIFLMGAVRARLCGERVDAVWVQDPAAGGGGRDR